MLLTVQNEEEKRYFEVVFSGARFSALNYDTHNCQ